MEKKESTLSKISSRARSSDRTPMRKVWCVICLEKKEIQNGAYCDKCRKLWGG